MVRTPDYWTNVVTCWFTILEPQFRQNVGYATSGPWLTEEVAIEITSIILRTYFQYPCDDLKGAILR